MAADVEARIEALERAVEQLVGNLERITAVLEGVLLPEPAQP